MEESGPGPAGPVQAGTCPACRDECAAGETCSEAACPMRQPPGARVYVDADGRPVAETPAGRYLFDVEWPAVRVWRLERGSAKAKFWVRWEVERDGRPAVEDSWYEDERPETRLPYVDPSPEAVEAVLDLVRGATYFAAAAPRPGSGQGDDA